MADIPDIRKELERVYSLSSRLNEGSREVRDNLLSIKNSNNYYFIRYIAGEQLGFPKNELIEQVKEGIGILEIRVKSHNDYIATMANSDLKTMVCESDEKEVRKLARRALGQSGLRIFFGELL